MITIQWWMLIVAFYAGMGIGFCIHGLFLIGGASEDDAG